jgi:hypothetical protein
LSSVLHRPRGAPISLCARGASWVPCSSIQRTFGTDIAQQKFVKGCEAQVNAPLANRSELGELSRGRDERLHVG